MAVYTPFAAGQRLTADALNSLIVTETMAWTNLASVGAFASGFAAGSPAPRMRKVLKLGVEEWQFEGRITVTTLAAATSVTCFTFSAGFRVATERGFEQYTSNSAFNPMRVGFMAAGVLSIGVPTAAGSGVTGFLLDGITITNPLA